MATNAESGQAQVFADPATLAFEALREEVALVRRAMAGLAASREANEPPDYSLTLGKIARETEAMAAHLNMLAALPALRLTARDWAREIAAAGMEARRSDQEALTQARDAFRHAAHDMSAKLASARSAEIQRQWLLWIGACGFFAGILALAIAIGPIVRAAPESWHWPEAIAAGIVGVDQEAAGARLIAIAAPDRWRDIVLGYRIVSDNRDAIDRCRKGSTNTREPVRCAIVIGTEALP
jgi:Family of unknown function (DUF6118)